MNIQEALHSLGVRDNTLTAEEKDKLDRDGYLPLPGILSAQQIDKIAARLDELVRQEGENAGKEVHQEAGTDSMADLVNKEPIFQTCFTHPRGLARLAPV